MTIELAYTLKTSALMDRSRAQFKGYEAAGVLNRSYAAIVVLLLRLRQACDHPFLVFGRDADLAEAKVEMATSSSSSSALFNETLSVDYLRKLYRRYREHREYSPMRSPQSAAQEPRVADDEHFSTVLTQIQVHVFIRSLVMHA